VARVASSPCKTERRGVSQAIPRPAHGLLVVSDPEWLASMGEEPSASLSDPAKIFFDLGQRPLSQLLGQAEIAEVWKSAVTRTQRSCVELIAPVPIRRVCADDTTIAAHGLALSRT
jgi:hypothetical protein